MQDTKLTSKDPISDINFTQLAIEKFQNPWCKRKAETDRISDFLANGWFKDACDQLTYSWRPGAHSFTQRNPFFKKRYLDIKNLDEFKSYLGPALQPDDYFSALIKTVELYNQAQEVKPAKNPSLFHYNYFDCSPLLNPASSDQLRINDHFDVNFAFIDNTTIKLCKKTLTLLNKKFTELQKSPGNEILHFTIDCIEPKIMGSDGERRIIPYVSIEAWFDIVKTDNKPVILSEKDSQSLVVNNKLEKNLQNNIPNTPKTRTYKNKWKPNNKNRVRQVKITPIPSVNQPLNDHIIFK